MMKTGSGDSPGGVARDSAETGRSQSSEPGPGMEQKLCDTALAQTPSLWLAESPGGPCRRSEAQCFHLQSENYSVQNEENGGKSHGDTFRVADFK